MLKRFTQEEIKQIVVMWPDHTVQAIARKLKRSYYSILDLAKLIRKRGYDLPKKTNKENLTRKIRNVMDSLKK